MGKETKVIRKTLTSTVEGAEMHKWEYAFIEYVREQRGFDFRNGIYYWGDDKGLTLSIQERLNTLGADGWEVAGSCGTNSYICWTLKRPVKNSSKSPVKTSNKRK